MSAAPGYPPRREDDPGGPVRGPPPLIPSIFPTSSAPTSPRTARFLPGRSEPAPPRSDSVAWTSPPSGRAVLRQMKDLAHVAANPCVDRAILPAGTRGRGRRAAQAGPFPRMERLEDRTLLAKVTVHIFNFEFSANPRGSDRRPHHPHRRHDPLGPRRGHAHHDLRAGGAVSWNSGTMNAGNTFDHTFTHSGTFEYYCGFHGVDNGNGTAGGMSGRSRSSA